MEWTRDRPSPSRPGPGWRPCPQRREDGDFTLVHGSPRDPTWEYVTSRRRSRAPACRPSRREHGLHGHTHVPIAFTEVDGRMRTLAPRAGQHGRARRGPDAAQPRQRRPAARRRPAGELPDPRHRARDGDLGARRATTSRPSGRDAAAGPAAAAWPTGCASAPDAAVIGGRRPLQGRKPGDRRVRVERPHAPYFRYTGAGQLTAKEAASAPTTADGQGVRIGPRRSSSAPARQRGRARRAAVEEEGAGDLQLGRHLARPPTRPRRSCAS